MSAERAQATAQRIFDEWQRGMNADRWYGLVKGRLLSDDVSVRMDVTGPMQALLVVTIDDEEHEFDFPEDWLIWRADAEALERTDLLEVAHRICLFPEHEWWT